MLEIRNLTKTKLDRTLLRKAEKTVLSMAPEKLSQQFLLSAKTITSLVVVGNKRMRMLNKERCNKNRTTDVLSFGGGSAKEGKQKNFVNPPAGRRQLGEVVICYPCAKKQAKRLGYPLKIEMTILLIHGILHLLGYHHEKNKEEALETGKKEISILNRIVTYA